MPGVEQQYNHTAARHAHTRRDGRARQQQTELAKRVLGKMGVKVCARIRLGRKRV
jgi:hypothetical protein